MDIQNNKKVLIVEDDEVIQQLLQWRLAELGYSVCGKVTTGLEAIMAARSTNPDAVLMDIRLKGTMDGVTTAKHIKKEFNAPVVFVTAFLDDDVLARVKEADADGFILKPFEDSDLRIALELAIGKSP